MWLIEDQKINREDYAVGLVSCGGGVNGYKSLDIGRSYICECGDKEANIILSCNALRERTIPCEDA